MMNLLALTLLAASVLLIAYTYLGYPLILKSLGLFARPVQSATPLTDWPEVSITLPVHNEAETVRATLESLLNLDYPIERRQILVVSDASTDGTDDVVAEFADRGVELIRMPQRRGKTAAENAALPHLRGQIVVNTDASVRIRPDALKELITAFADTSVGLASGRDVSVGPRQGEVNLGESKYVGFEMWLRALETRVSGIVGASGCFYAIRASLHRNTLPEGLSRDFAAALIARERGYRAVSVNEAVCFVPRAASLRPEYGRKVRTIGRGLQTLFYKRSLLNPFRYSLFAWMLFSHKLCRWLVPWALVVGLGSLGVLSATAPWARWTLGGVTLSGILAGLGLNVLERRRIPRMLALPAYLAVGNLAALHAWSRVLRRRGNAMWEPTRREVLDAS